MAWGNKTKTPGKAGGTSEAEPRAAGLEDLFAAERGPDTARSKDEFDLEFDLDSDPVPAPRAQPQAKPQPAAKPQAAVPHDPVPEPPPPPVVQPPAHSPSNIGESVRIEGELSGTEDTTVEGTVEGIVALPDHCLTVAPKGCVHAEIQARAVAIHGKVVGNITAVDVVEVMPSGSMDGDIRAGRVVLMDGAKFRGNIHMGWQPEQGEEVTGDQAEQQPQGAEKSSPEKAEKAKSSDSSPEDKKTTQPAPKSESKADAKTEPKKG